MDTNLKDCQDTEDLGNFKLPINGKMSIAILKIPQPMIIIGNQVNFLSNCTCNRNGICKICTNTGKIVSSNTKNSLIKLDSFNKSDKLDNKHLNKPKNKRKPKHKRRIKKYNTNKKKNINSNKNKTIRKEKKKRINKIIRNRYLNGISKLNKIKRLNLNRNSSVNKINIAESIITNNNQNKDSSEINVNTDILSEKTDKCVDTCDIDYSFNSNQKPTNFNILDHLNEVESLLNIERKRRFSEIRRDYSILRDRIEEKFHLVISSCNQRLLNLNSSYLNAISTIKSNIPTLKLPKLNHIKNELNLL